MISLSTGNERYPVKLWNKLCWYIVPGSQFLELSSCLCMFLELAPWQQMSPGPLAPYSKPSSHYHMWTLLVSGLSHMSNLPGLELLPDCLIFSSLDLRWLIKHYFWFGSGLPLQTDLLSSSFCSMRTSFMLFCFCLFPYNTSRSFPTQGSVLC